jgi:arylsulfatase A-like enzyme
MATATKRRAVVLVVDGWGAGYLGPYGNTWLETPACNQLASEGLLLEHTLVDAPSISAFYRAAWSATHAALPSRQAAPPLARVLAHHRRSACLISDSRAVIEHPLAADFGHAELVPPVPSASVASTPEHTQLAQLIATAAASLHRDPADLIWIHSNGMNAAWDAPYEFREQFRDADDPPVPVDVHPPEGTVGANVDPDHIQGWVWAYAGQVALLDQCLEGLLASWHQIGEPALLIVMGARGFALADHGTWANEHAALYSEHLHIPLMIVSNSIDDLAGVRCQPLVQPNHLYSTLVKWFNPDSAESEAMRGLLDLQAQDLSLDGSAWPPVAAAQAGHRWAIRTPTWHACNWIARSDAVDSDASPADLADSCRLYLKPDDRWDINDVASRCHEIVTRFARLHQQLNKLPPGADLNNLLPLDPALLSPPE